ncbi:hypothetical protein IP91_01107 [Pseudoduganella lurida]|uniref:Uncharacterized protein n=1 Tax=Pseudoduganella lurida TaxID=1036180 RepID=A0A562RLZ3_9BURK|nr:hypothetical protein IP91_01107 [Pseudoduganella lurida]
MLALARAILQGESVGRCEPDFALLPRNMILNLPPPMFHPD